MVIGLVSAQEIPSLEDLLARRGIRKDAVFGDYHDYIERMEKVRSKKGKWSWMRWPDFFTSFLMRVARRR
jgi:hypothetical protein